MSFYHDYVVFLNFLFGCVGQGRKYEPMTMNYHEGDHPGEIVLS